ncbi:MAG TPA: SMI1/KNR4 family protein [Kofleriaceae bacterium]|jgi:hypothetical protein
MRSSPVVEILDDRHPIGALRRFLEGVRGAATPQQAQIALGAAQLLLLPVSADQRGGHDVREIVDLVLERWNDFADRRTGYHAQEFLRNALVGVGVDRARIARLEERVPAEANGELLFDLACAHAVARDKVAMLLAVERALEVGVTSAQFRRDPEFAPYQADPDLCAILARADVPPIPVDVEPHVVPVRRALDHVVATLRELGMRVELRPPVRLDAILDAERARKISLPNDYRALLAITNGMQLWDCEFFAAGDYREPTKLALRAQAYVHASGDSALEECVPLAGWGRATDWLLYDPRGRIRGGDSGYVLLESGEPTAIDDLAAALARIEELAREVLGTN